MKLRWTRAARNDRDRIYAYILAEQPEAAMRLDDRFRERADQLAELPQLGRAGRVPGTRELSISGNHYLMVYRVDADIVWIVRVLHTAQQWPQQD